MARQRSSTKRLSIRQIYYGKKEPLSHFTGSERHNVTIHQVPEYFLTAIWQIQVSFIFLVAILLH